METYVGYTQSDVSLGLQERTVRCHLFGRRAVFVSRSEFIEALTQHGADDMIGMWKAENPFEIFVTFKTEATVITLVEKVRNFHIGETAVYISSQNSIMNEVRIHWAPLHMEEGFFDCFFRDKGFTVVSCRMEKDMNDGLLNGVRLYRLVGTKQEWDELPHVVNFKDYGFQTLFKVAGRDPLCLKCKKFGHQRAQCDQNRGAQFAKRQQEQRQQQELQKQQSSKNLPPRRWEKPTLTVLKATTAGEDNLSVSSSDETDMKSVEEGELVVAEAVATEVKNSSGVEAESVGTGEAENDGTGEATSERAGETERLGAVEVESLARPESVGEMEATMSEVMDSGDIPCGQVPPPLQYDSDGGQETQVSSSRISEVMRLGQILRGTQAPKSKRLHAGSGGKKKQKLNK